MQELNLDQLQAVNGGVIPFVIAVVAIDLGLIASMGIVQSAIVQLS